MKIKKIPNPSCLKNKLKNKLKFILKMLKLRYPKIKFKNMLKLKKILKNSYLKNNLKNLKNKSRNFNLKMIILKLIKS